MALIPYIVEARRNILYKSIINLYSSCITIIFLPFGPAPWAQQTTVFCPELHPPAKVQLAPRYITRPIV